MFFSEIKLWLLAFCVHLNGSDLQGSLHFMLTSTAGAHDVCLGPFFKCLEISWPMDSLWGNCYPQRKRVLLSQWLQANSQAWLSLYWLVTCPSLKQSLFEEGWGLLLVRPELYPSSTTKMWGQSSKLHVDRKWSRVGSPESCWSDRRWWFPLDEARPWALAAVLCITRWVT